MSKQLAGALKTREWVENAGVDNTARDDKGGQGGSGNTGQINVTKINFR